MRKTQYFQMEFKNVEVKEDGSSIFIEGLASTPDIDSYDDIVKPEAFRNTMGSYMQKPLILLQHNMEKIIGKAVDYRIEEAGLWIRVELINDVDNTFKNIQEGLLGAFSIGFRALKWDLRAEGDEGNERYIREITELRLVEVSVVSFPANENARFSLTKSIKSFFDGLSELKSLTTGAYEVKNADMEITNFEEEMKEEEIQEVEEKEEEVIENEEVVEEAETTEEVVEESTETEEIPEDAAPEGEEKEEAAIENETKTDDVETDGETPSDDDTEPVKSDEVKALESEIDSLKGIIEAKDVEIKELTESTNELKQTLSEKEDEIKSYLTVAPETKTETKSSTVNSLGALRYPEFK